MNPIEIIKKYYKPGSMAYKFLVKHSEAVAKKAVEIAKNCPQFNPDLHFIVEAAMLHDIGIFLTEAQSIDCFGKKPYICHGYLGRELLEKEGLPKHALICERHVGIGVSVQDIKDMKLPIPERDMLPVTVEEQIICLADKFFSKNEEHLTKEKSIEKIRSELSNFGMDKVKRFDELAKKFGIIE